MSTSVLWDFSVFSAWECSLSLVMFFTTCGEGSKNRQSATGGWRDGDGHRRDVVAGPSDLSEGLSFVLLSSILSNLLQRGGPLGSLLHFDQAGQQTHQQEEHQQAQQGDDGHVQRLQLVRFAEARRGDENRTINNSADLH